MRSRKLLSIIVLGVIAGAAVWSAVSAQTRAHYTNNREIRSSHFVRTLDTLCACVSDTTAGPSQYVYLAKSVIFRLQANSGTCSLLTVQVSNNDSTWVAAPNIFASSFTNFTVGDSLNTGGALVKLVATDSTRLQSNAVIPYKFARLVARQRTGYTTGTASAGPTVACRTRADSLRFHATVVWSNP